MTVITKKFPHSLEEFWEKCGKTEWSEIKQVTTAVAKQVFKGLTALFLYWQTPGFFWASFIVSIVMPHIMRESLIGRIYDVWEESMGWTTALITIGAFLALPSTLIVASLFSGAKIGSDLSIASQVKKKIKEYEEFTKEKLPDEDRDALFDFLFSGTNLCLYEKLLSQIENLQGHDDSECYKELHRVLFQFNGPISKFSTPKKIRRLIKKLLENVHDAKIRQFEKFTQTKLSNSEKTVLIQFLGTKKNLKFYEKLFDTLKGSHDVLMDQEKNKWLLYLKGLIEESENKEVLQSLVDRLVSHE